MSSKSHLPEQETLSQSDDAARVEGDGDIDGRVSGKPSGDENQPLEADGVRSITMEIPGEAIVTPARSESEEAEVPDSVQAGDAAPAGASDDEESPGDEGEASTPAALVFSSPTPRPSDGESDSESASAAAPSAEDGGSLPGATSPAAESDDEAFLRRVVLPATPPASPRSPAVGATPDYPFFDADSDDDRTVISEPPSPEVLAAMAPPAAPAGTRLGSRLEPTPAPFASFGARGARRVSLSLPQLGGLVATALLVGGIGGAALSGSDGEEPRPPISSARAEPQPVKRGLPEVVPLPPGARAEDDSQAQPQSIDRRSRAAAEPSLRPSADPAPAEEAPVQEPSRSEGGDPPPAQAAQVEAATSDPRPARTLEAIPLAPPRPTEAAGDSQEERVAKPAAAARPARAKKPAKQWVDPFE